MPHRNAPLAETGRLRLARCVVEGVPQAGERLLRAAPYLDPFPAGVADEDVVVEEPAQGGFAGRADRERQPRAAPLEFRDDLVVRCVQEVDELYGAWVDSDRTISRKVSDVRSSQGAQFSRLMSARSGRTRTADRRATGPRAGCPSGPRPGSRRG